VTERLFSVSRAASLHRGLVEGAQRVELLAPENMFWTTSRLSRRQVLVDDLDPEVEASAAADVDRLAVEKISPLSMREMPATHFDQRRLARPVVPTAR